MIDCLFWYTETVMALFVQSVPLRWCFLSMTNTHQSLSTSCLYHHKDYTQEYRSLSLTLTNSASRPSQTQPNYGQNVKGKNDSLASMAWFESLTPQESFRARHFIAVWHLRGVNNCWFCFTWRVPTYHTHTNST